jgi:excisionase family DNA binding protein
MKTMNHRTIEDWLGEIETEVHQVRLMLAELLSRKPIYQEAERGQLMNVKEVAKFLNVDIATVYSACSKGEINFLKIGKLYKFKKENVIKWMDKNKQSGIEDVDEYVNQYLHKNILKR